MFLVCAFLKTDYVHLNKSSMKCDIMKTCPCNIQRFFAIVKIENFIGQVFKRFQNACDLSALISLYDHIIINRDDSSVQRELLYPSRHALFGVTQSKLPRPIKYDGSRKLVVD